MRLPTLAAAVFLTFAPAFAQTAAVIPYGSACRDYNNSVSAPVLTVTGLPQLGAQVTVRYIGPNTAGLYGGSYPFLITGLGSTSLPVPRLTQAMSASCTLFVNPDVAVFFMPQVQSNPVRFLDRITYAIPNTPSLIGQSVFHQYGVVIWDNFGGANRLDYLMLSNGAEVRAGL
jgi:hypothetical protein